MRQVSKLAADSSMGSEGRQQDSADHGKRVYTQPCKSRSSVWGAGAVLLSSIFVG
jgi:hypothetical protein